MVQQKMNRFILTVPPENEKRTLGIDFGKDTIQDPLPVSIPAGSQIV
jgi:hypothetical protein